jgi:hypothetical protein
VVALRTTGPRQVVVDDTAVALRLLVDRRDQLGQTPTELMTPLFQDLPDCYAEKDCRPERASSGHHCERGLHACHC